MHNLSIVIPIDFSRRARDIYQRAIHFARTLANSGIQVIFGCAATPERWVKKFQNKILAYKNIHIALTENGASHLAKLRNIALAQVTTPYVLFLDVDISPQLEQIQQAYQDVLNSQAQLCMYPCLYLSAKGTRLINRVPINQFKNYYYQYKREWILHLAFPSSVIICDMQSVREIQAFDDAYVGHGYEDFDFMLRIFQHKNLIEYSHALQGDEPYLAPLMATGFRALLANAQLEQLIQPTYFLHEYHAKNKNEDYYLLRKNNKTHFMQKFLALKSAQAHALIYEHDLLFNFFHLLKTHNIKPSEYSALWAEIPGHMFRGRGLLHGF